MIQFDYLISKLPLNVVIFFKLLNLHFRMTVRDIVNNVKNFVKVTTRRTSLVMLSDTRYAGLRAQCQSIANNHSCEIELTAKFKNEEQFKRLEANNFEDCRSLFDKALEQNPVHIQRLIEKQDVNLTIEQLLEFDFKDYFSIGIISCPTQLVQFIESSWIYHLDCSNL